MANYEKLTLLGSTCLLTIQLYAQKEPANNDEKLKDSSMQQSTQLSTASTHIPFKEQEWIMILLVPLIIVAVLAIVRKTGKR